MATARWAQVTAVVLAGAALGACQVLAGLGDLEATSGAGGSSVSGPASGGGGPGGAGGGAGGNGAGGSGTAGGGGSGGGGGGGALVVQEVRTEPDASPIQHLAVDGSHVYFGGPSLWRAQLAGGAKQHLLGAPQSIQGLAVDSTYIFYTRSTTGVLRFLKGTLTGPDIIEQWQNELMGPIVIAGSFVHYITGPNMGNPGSPQGTGVYCEDAASSDPTPNNTSYGGAPVYVAGAIVRADAFQPARIYYHRIDGVWWKRACPAADAEGLLAAYDVGNDGPPFGLAADGQHAYWTHRRDGGGLYRKLLLSDFNQPNEVFAANQDYPRHVAVAGGYVYWSTSSAGCDAPTGEIRRKSTADANATAELVHGGRICPSNFATDPAGEYLYWADQGVIYRLRVAP